MKLLAYHNDPAIKAKYLERVRTHIALDELIHGKYWENGKGCAVGCTIHSASHEQYEVELGIPRVLANLEDGIFEGMSNGRSKKWPEQFLSVIAVGADLSKVWAQFACWLMLDGTYGVIQFAKDDAAKKAIRAVGDAYGQVAAGSKKKIPWSTLRSDADASAYAAAYADAAAEAAYAADASASAYAAATYAAYAAAYAADAYAADADDAAEAAAAAAYAERRKHREAQADKLLELLAACPGKQAGMLK